MPTILLRVLKGVDFIPESNNDFSSSESMNHTGEPISFLEGQRFLCIGEIVCTLRLAMYNSGYSLSEPALQNSFILAVV